MTKFEHLKRAHIRACRQGVERVYTHNEVAVFLREVDQIQKERDELEKAFDMAMTMVSKFYKTLYGTMDHMDEGWKLLSIALNEIPVIRHMIQEAENDR